jgi:Ca2+:H+ antiporter
VQDTSVTLDWLLVLVVIAVLLPAMFDYTERNVFGAGDAMSLDAHLSLGVAIVLIGVYAANLVYTLVTHRDVFATGEAGRARARRQRCWSRRFW